MFYNSPISISSNESLFSTIKRQKTPEQFIEEIERLNNYLKLFGNEKDDEVDCVFNSVKMLSE